MAISGGVSSLWKDSAWFPRTTAIRSASKVNAEERHRNRAGGERVSPEQPDEDRGDAGQCDGPRRRLPGERDGKRESAEGDPVGGPGDEWEKRDRHERRAGKRNELGPSGQNVSTVSTGAAGDSVGEATPRPLETAG